MERDISQRNFIRADKYGTDRTALPRAVDECQETGSVLYMTGGPFDLRSESARNLTDVPALTDYQLRHVWGYLAALPGERPLAAALEQAVASARRTFPDPPASAITPWPPCREPHGRSAVCTDCM